MLKLRSPRTTLSVSLLVFVSVSVGAASTLSGCGGIVSSDGTSTTNGDDGTSSTSTSWPTSTATGFPTSTSTSTSTTTATATGTATTTSTAPRRDTSGEAWDGGPWVPAGAPTSLEVVRDAMVGHWIGVVRTPWTSANLVDLTFTADSGPYSGGYTSHCIEPAGGCVAMYYGTDADDPLKTFALEDIKANTAVDGAIAILFAGGNAGPGTLRNLVLDATNSGLRFEVYNREYGPLRFDLRRVP